jgi:SAM-dependent methyltransferase
VDLERYYANYFVKNQRLDSYIRISYRRRVKWLTHCGLSRQARILEVGCGNGLFVDYLREHGFESVRGYDAFVPRFADEGWRAESFDAILSYGVIEHVVDPRAFLSEQLARMEPGGLLSVCTPNAAEIALNERGEIDLHQPYHRHILSLQALQGLGREVGLELLRTSGRYWMDSWVPFVNWRFVSSYVYRLGNALDVVFEPPRLATILTSPRLLFYGFFGYYLPSRSHMRVAFRKPASLGADVGR